MHNPKIEKTSIEGVLIIHPAKHEDERGYFLEIFNKSNIPQFKDLEFENHSINQ